MSRPLLLCVVMVLCSLTLARGHELPEGEIERRVQVSVKPDCVLVEYSLGMGEATLDRELRKKEIVPAKTLSERWKQFQKIIVPSLRKNIVVTEDGDPLDLKPIRANYLGWSHRHLTCIWKADMKLSGKLTTVAVTDGNFLDTPGNYRIAMKGRSGARMEKSNVPPTCSRAKPVELSQLSMEKKQAATRVEGQFMPSGSKKRNVEGKLSPSSTDESRLESNGG